MSDTPKLIDAVEGDSVHRLVVDLHSGWTPFADEISGIMRKASDEILRLQITEDAFALAMAKNVPVQYWAETIAHARRLMVDPEEWRKLGQAPPIYLHNVQVVAPATLEPDSTNDVMAG